MLGVLACALTYGALVTIPKCDVTPPCVLPPPDGNVIYACTMIKMIGPCPVGLLGGLGSVAIGATVAVWTSRARRRSAT